MRVGILTSGGDAPGMNAVLLGAAEQAEAAGHELIGFADGFAGMVAGTWSPITRSVAMVHADQPGTVLGTSRGGELREPAGIIRALKAAEDASVQALIVIGGNGSLIASQRLSAEGLVVSFVPATIDNDVPGSEVTIGFDSAVWYGVDAVERLRVTGHSLRGRAFLLQVLGGDTSFLATAVAQASGVPTVLTVEESPALDRVAKALAERAADGEAIAIVAEGAGDAVRLAEALEHLVGVRIRPTILGHTQRAAPPSDFDRRIAHAAGRISVNEASAGRSCLLWLGRPDQVIASPLLAPATPHLTDVSVTRTGVNS